MGQTSDLLYLNTNQSTAKGFLFGVQIPTDPQLRWESKLYAANLRRLNHPFLVTAFCFSQDESAAQQVASEVIPVYIY